MNKNSFLVPKLPRSNISLFAILAMFTGLFFSRALLSMAMMLYGLNALAGISPRRWFKDKWWLLGLAWVLCYIVSYFWSNDISYWGTRVQVKAPVLLLPLAFRYAPSLSYRQLRLFTIVLSLLLLYGAGYSLYFYLSEPAAYLEGYIYAHILPTIAGNDHIVFSLTVACSIVWFVFFFPQLTDKPAKWFVGATVVILSAYLHILAARTGLIAWYVFVAGWTVYLSLKKKTRAVGIGLIVFFVVAGVLAFNYIPTLRERVGYFKYTLIAHRERGWSGEYSDMGRVISYDIAGKLIREHPLKGVGAGNILDTMKKGYDRWYPQVKEEQRLIPHNQFLTVAVACGIPAFVLFIAWVVYPLKKIRRNRSGFFFLATWCMLLVPLMVEPILEIQLGVFVYLFFLFWQYHCMRETEPE